MHSTTNDWQRGCLSELARFEQSFPLRSLLNHTSGIPDYFQFERLGGMSLGRHARRTLFEPLGIRRLGFDEDRFSLIEGRVFSYEADARRPQGYKQYLGNANTVGDGGVYGRTDDLLAWERDGHSQWRDPASLLHTMLQPSRLADGTVLPYRFGLEIAQDAGRTVVFHGGGLWGFHTLILRLPDEGLSLLHLANCEAAAPDQARLLAALAA